MNPGGFSSVVVDIRLAVGQAPQIERPAGPRRLQTLVELTQYVVISKESRHTNDLAYRPDRPVVISIHLRGQGGHG